MIVNVGLKRTQLTLAQRVSSILRKYGTDAHLYLPGIGVINGLTAGNYLDSVGTTAATVDNPVGLVLDGAGAFSSPLFNAVNVTAGAAAGGAVVVGLSTNYATVAGKSYQVTYTLTACVGNISSQAGGAAGLSQTNFVGTYSEILVAVTTGTTNIGLVARGSGLTSCTGSVTVKEVTGIHALQATTANKPILRRGAVNLLTYSEQFDNAAWTKIRCSITPNATIAPNGTLTADKIVEDTSLNSHAVTQLTYTPSIGNIVGSIHVKAGERTYAQVRVTGSANGVQVIGSIKVDLIAGVIAAVDGPLINYGIVPADYGFYRVWGSVAQSTTTRGDIQVYPTTSSAGLTSPAYQGDGVSGIYVWGAQLETGSVVTDYIPTTTALASSSTGNYHWIADSTDLLTATYPAGYESVTVINALAAGQQTLTAQNIVGSYSIGPSVDTYGRFIFRTGLTASELTTMQTFANRLAGV